MNPLIIKALCWRTPCGILSMASDGVNAGYAQDVESYRQGWQCHRARDTIWQRVFQVTDSLACLLS